MDNDRTKYHKLFLSKAVYKELLSGLCAEMSQWRRRGCGLTVLWNVLCAWRSLAVVAIATGIDGRTSFGNDHICKSFDNDHMS